MKTMYNRYIPQPDGSYRRRPMPEPCPPPPQPEPCPPEPEPPKPCTPCPPKSPQRPQHRPRPQPHRQEPAGNFLQQLLPKDFDTGDLIVILLLLLMACDCEEDRNNALLTIALYLMM